MDWILSDASHLCPSCHKSFPADKIANPRDPADVFAVYNECLRDKHKQYCCFVCSNLFPLSDTEHVVKCFQQLFDARSARSPDFKNVCVTYTGIFQQWKQAMFIVCSVASCVDTAWKDDNAYSSMAGTAAITCLIMKKSSPELISRSRRLALLLHQHQRLEAVSNPPSTAHIPLHLSYFAFMPSTLTTGIV